jgi:hypothetical protein
MSKKIRFRVPSYLIMLFVLLVAYQSAVAQSSNPCNDAEFLRLKSLPKASLTESERKTFNKLNANCEKFKQDATPQMLNQIATAKQRSQSDTAKVVLKEEPFATTRNFTILGAMCAAIAGIIVALNSVADSPF